MDWKDYKPVDIDFRGEKIEDREAIVTLDNGTEIHICACCESWEQYGGCKDELGATVDIAECINGWLHGREDEPPAKVYGYIENN